MKMFFVDLFCALLGATLIGMPFIIYFMEMKP